MLNRSGERLRELEGDLGRQQVPGIERVRFVPLAESPMDPEDGAIFINATALGLKATDPSPIEGAYLRPGVVVYDTTYGVANRLGRICAEAGIDYADGLSMLVWQGVRSLEIWTGKPVPAAVMRAAAENELKKRKTHG